MLKLYLEREAKWSFLFWLGFEVRFLFYHFTGKETKTKTSCAFPKSTSIVSAKAGLHQSLDTAHCAQVDVLGKNNTQLFFSIKPFSLPIMCTHNVANIWFKIISLHCSQFSSWKSSRQQLRRPEFWSQLYY